MTYAAHELRYAIESYRGQIRCFASDSDDAAHFASKALFIPGPPKPVIGSADLFTVDFLGSGNADYTVTLRRKAENGEQG